MVVSDRFVYVRKGSGLKGWRDLLSYWHDYIEEYCLEMGPDDVPYIYGERAQISCLSAGAVRNGWFALEEFGAVKGMSSDSQKNGRVDLWLKKKSIQYYVEAKVIWGSIDSPRLGQTVYKSMGIKALPDASRTAGWEADGSVTIAVVFVRIYQNRKKKFSRSDAMNRMRNIAEDGKYDAFSVFFPREMEDAPDESLISNNRVPGVAIFIKKYTANASDC